MTGKRKVIRQKAHTKDLSDLSIQSLLSLYDFVCDDYNKSFSAVSKEARDLIIKKKNDIEDEIYKRTYGFNPIKKYPARAFNSKPPEVKKLVDSNEEIQKRFIVKKNLG